MQAPYDDTETEEWETGAGRNESSFRIFDTHTLYHKLREFKEKFSKKFKKVSVAVDDQVTDEVDESCKPGDEMTQELTDAWNLFTRVNYSLFHIFNNLILFSIPPVVVPSTH